MMKKPFAIAAMMTKAALLSTFVAGAAFAQTTTVTETTVPADAIPLAYQGLSDVQVKDFVTTRGLTDVTVSRADGHITATGSRNGNTVTLIYNEQDGKLIKVDGNDPDDAARASFLNLGDANKTD